MDRSYYAVIPATVRYDKDLMSGAKLLYGEITALCNDKGFCWANNSYFAELYGVSKQTVINWLNSLIDCGYIKTKIAYKPGTKTVKSRMIFILDAQLKSKKIKAAVPSKENFNTLVKETCQPSKENLSTPSKENFTDNITVFNNTNNIKEINKEKSEKPKRHRYGEYKNVLLSDDEFNKLKTEFPDDWQKRIENLDGYIEIKGAKYKNHLATIRVWARKDNNNADVKGTDKSERYRGGINL